jgi:outer membrane protein assembly factor BamB
MRSMLSYQALAMTISLSVFSCLGQAEEWTQWRGPNRDAKSTETGLSNSWPSGGPKLVWQAKDLGAGFSTPSAAGGLAYLITNTGMETEQIVCLDMKNGQTKWKTRIGAVGKNEGPQYPGSRSTPTIDNGRVYALGSDGDLVCVEAASGSLVWAKNMRKDFDGAQGMWAYTESPLIDGEALICSPGGKSSTIVSLNKKDGSVRWKSALPEADSASYSSPVIANINGVKQYVFFLAKGVAGIKADTGEYLWRFTKTSDAQANVQTPVVKDSFVYTGASRIGGGLAQVVQGAKEAKEVYFDKTLPTGMGGAVLVGDYLYGSSGSALMCVEYATGKVKWQDRSIGTCSVCYADGKLYLHGDNNEIAMVAASPDAYKELGRATPPNAPDRGRSKAWTHPVIIDGRLVIHDSGSVWCYDIRE